jgi:error-prone DNA polymerase
MRCLERPAARPLLEDLDDEEDDGDLLPALTPQEEVIADYRTAGLSLEAHPLQFEREWLAAHGVATVAEAGGLPEGRRVLVAGIVLTRQRPATAKGMIFLTIEDETAAANIVVRPDVWAAADHAARRAAVLIVEGRIQRRGAVVHIVATRLESALGSPPHLAAESAVADADPGAATAAALPSLTSPGEFASSPPALAALPRTSRDFC